MRTLLVSVAFMVGFLFTLVFGSYYFYFSAPDRTDTRTAVFVVTRNTDFDTAVDQLQSEGFIRKVWAFHLINGFPGSIAEIKPGGYSLSKNMSLVQIRNKLSSSPDQIWVSIPEGLRKEQIGERLASSLGWSESDLTYWNETATAMKYDYLEGVYFPDTYLIPASEAPGEVANRMISHFNEKLSPYFGEFYQKDILWTTGLKVASLIDRETANPADMPLISGIIWNRLSRGMRLEIDATLQYARGKVGDRWWGPVSGADKRVDSPYNTYRHTGLPPTPIDNPGMDAILAALNPAETDCLYYLHAPDTRMYCSRTYEEHLANINAYLR